MNIFIVIIMGIFAGSFSFLTFLKCVDKKWSFGKVYLNWLMIILPLPLLLVLIIYEGIITP